jgi:hypothetical protein
MKKLSRKFAESRLERHVLGWLNSRASDYEDGVAGVLHDLMYGGCVSGYVGHLIYYRDTVKFFQTHRRDISALLKDALSDSGAKGPGDLFGDKWDNEDPLAQEDMNRNLLAWFGFEEAARNIANRAGIDC